MAYIFDQDELPKLVSAVPGRERVFFVNKELTKMDDMLAGIMRYKEGAASPYHLHENCEHFYFIIDGIGSVETPEGVREVKSGFECGLSLRNFNDLNEGDQLEVYEIQEVARTL